MATKIKKYKIKSYAKINLSLDVIKIRKDGYHEIDTILHNINNLYDEVEITVSKNINNTKPHINVDCGNFSIPKKSNLAYKACKLMCDTYNINDHLNIKIKKKIPLSSGLAGGSSNAASCIMALNKIYKLNLDDKKLCKIAQKIGADVSHFILGGNTRARGFGEKLTKLNKFKMPVLLLAKAGKKSATKDIYKKIDMYKKDFGRININKIVKLLRNNDVRNASLYMGNILEKAYSKNNKIRKIKNIMLESNAYYSSMSGAGPTVYGFFKNKKDARICLNKLKRSDKNIWVSIQ